VDQLGRSRSVRRLATAVTAAVAFCSLASCAGNPGAVKGYESYKISTGVDLGASGVVVFRSDWEHEMGRERATVRVRNTTEAMQTLRYRFRWLDQGGESLGSDEAGWRQVEIEGGQVVPLAGVTALKGAVDFILEIDSRR
jgi:uncharacterized protein YcfL